MHASLLTDTGGSAGALIAIFAFVALVARAKPVRWMWRKLVGDPATTWLRAEVERAVEGCVAPIHEQLKPNGGHSLRDRVDAIERLVRGDESPREPVGLGLVAGGWMVVRDLGDRAVKAFTGHHPS